jgi:hypothetical protein
VEQEAAAASIRCHDVRTEAESVEVGVLVAHQCGSDPLRLVVWGDGEQRQEPVLPTGATVTNARQECLEPVWAFAVRWQLPLQSRHGK